MGKTVGIPRALLYYYYQELWINFFQFMGFDVQISSKTNKSIINQGVSSTVDEACLPVKVYFGHLMDLLDRVDYLFVPRMVSVERKEFICPKLLGLPDMVKASFRQTPVIIDVTINMHDKKSAMNSVVREIAERIEVPYQKAWLAWQQAEKIHLQYREKLSQTSKGKAEQSLPIAVLGHGYNIYDQFINMSLSEKLQDMGAEIRTKEYVPKDVVDAITAELPKRMYWTFGKQLLGSGMYFLRDDEIKGIIFVAAFGCGPDSLIGELLERQARRIPDKPFLFITIDEHTGEAGMITRLEAFMDMIKRRAS